MYIIKGRSREYGIHPQDVERSKHAAIDARDQAMEMPLKDAAMERRRAIKAFSLAQYSGNREQMDRARARARTIRRAMEERINK